MTESHTIIKCNKLFNEAIVEALISQSYSQSKIKFLHSTCGNTTKVDCLSNGFRCTLHVNRNSAKYAKSPNFTLAIDKNKLSEFNNSLFAFIDEVADSVYIVNGIKLLSYIVDHIDDVRCCADNVNKSWILISKKSIVDMTTTNKNNIIHYDRNVANLISANCID